MFALSIHSNASIVIVYSTSQLFEDYVKLFILSFF